MRRNLELKARCEDLERARKAALALGAEPCGVLKQTDTYFRSHAGRLKLRELEGGSAELISYDRPDETGARVSRYRLLPVADPAPLGTFLTESLGVLCKVRKERRLLTWRGVRIHLDRVESLGSFLEFEAVLDDGGTEQEAAQRLQDLRGALGVEASHLVPRSYSDLVRETGGAP